MHSFKGVIISVILYQCTFKRSIACGIEHGFRAGRTVRCRDRQGYSDILRQCDGVFALIRLFALFTVIIFVNHVIGSDGYSWRQFRQHLPVIAQYDDLVAGFGCVDFAHFGIRRIDPALAGISLTCKVIFMIAFRYLAVGRYIVSIGIVLAVDGKVFRFGFFDNIVGSVSLFPAFAIQLAHINSTQIAGSLPGIPVLISEVIYVDNLVGTGSYHGDFFPVIAEDDDMIPICSCLNTFGHGSVRPVAAKIII